MPHFLSTARIFCVFVNILANELEILLQKVRSKFLSNFDTFTLQYKSSKFCQNLGGTRELLITTVLPMWDNLRKIKLTN